MKHKEITKRELIEIGKNKSTNESLQLIGIDKDKNTKVWALYEADKKGFKKQIPKLILDVKI